MVVKSAKGVSLHEHKLRQAIIPVAAAQQLVETATSDIRFDRERGARSSPMATKMKTSEMGLPNTGEVIAFMVDCLGVRKRGNKESFKEYDELKKLKKGSLATEEHGRIARKT